MSRNNSGIILVVVLWVMAILSIMAVSLGRRTTVELAMTKYVVGKARANQLAWAGINLARDLIGQDSQDDEFKGRDTLYHCGVAGGEIIERLFKERQLRSGLVSVSYLTSSKDIFGYGSQGALEVYGLEDEERKLNINTLPVQNIRIFEELLKIVDVDEETAQTIAASVIDWRDSDSTLTNDNYGAEDEYYMSGHVPYHVKNLPFDSLHELLMVRGMTMDIFEKIKPLITIYPRAGSFRINFDTASRAVLQSLARSFTGPGTNRDVVDADALVESMIRYRNGDDGRAFSEDDRSIERNEMTINQSEGAFFDTLSPLRARVANFFRVRSLGRESRNKISTVIEAVIYRDDLQIVYWQVN